jgi:hypothetical protein
VKLEGLFRYYVLTQETRESWAFCTLIASHLEWPRVCPFPEQVLHGIAKRLCLNSIVWRTLDVGVITAWLLEHFDKSESDLYWRFSQGPWNPTKKKGPLTQARFMFDYSDMSLSPVVLESDSGTGIRDQSLGPDFVSQDEHWLSDEYITTTRPWMRTAKLNETEESLRENECEFGNRIDYLDQFVIQGGYDMQVKPITAPNNALVIIPLALWACVEYMKSSTVLGGLDLLDKAAVRGALRWQLNISGGRGGADVTRKVFCITEK